MAKSPPVTGTDPAATSVTTAAPKRPRRRASDRNGTGRPEPTLRILDTRILRGPNYWAHEPVVRMLVDLGVLEDFPSNKIPAFTETLVELMPTLEDHACSLGRRGGFISRLEDGTWMGHVAEHIALEFQNLAGTDVRHGKTRSAGVKGQYNCIFEYREEQVGIEAGRMAVGLVNHLVAPTDPAHLFDFAVEMERLISLAEKRAFGPSTQALIDEAVSRDIPFIRLDRHSLVQFGHGVHQQRIRATMTSQTSAIGVDIASDKSLTNRLLDSAGLPVPRSTWSRPRSSGRSREAARLPVRRQAARRQPRARRPPRPARRGRRPRRVRRRAPREPIAATWSSRRTSPATTTAAWSSAARWPRWPSGCPASVTGDGEHTVRQLVDIANADPRRGIGHEKVLTRIKLDDAAARARRAPRGSSSTQSRPRAPGSSSR